MGWCGAPPPLPPKAKLSIRLFCLLLANFRVPYFYEVTSCDQSTPPFPSFTVDVDTLVSELAVSNHLEAFIDSLQSWRLIVNGGEPDSPDTMSSPFLQGVEEKIWVKWPINWRALVRTYKAHCTPPGGFIGRQRSSVVLGCWPRRNWSSTKRRKGRITW